MLKIIKFIFILFLSWILFQNTFSSSVQTSDYNDLVRKVTNKIILLGRENNLNLEVIVSRIDVLLNNKAYTSEFKNFVIDVNEALKVRSCNNYYPTHNNITASVFWIWEEANSSNAYITNNVSAWDVRWVEHLEQGIENTYYFALPYNDFGDNWVRKANSKDIPWYKSKEWKNNESIVKNRWVKISHNWKTVFAQWEDVGPLSTDDVNYVFWNSEPKNTFWLQAWIDLSPHAS